MKLKHSDFFPSGKLQAQSLKPKGNRRGGGRGGEKKKRRRGETHTHAKKKTERGGENTHALRKQKEKERQADIKQAQSYGNMMHSLTDVSMTRP